MRNKKAGYGLGAVELLAAIQMWAVWLAPFGVTKSAETGHPLQSVLAVLSLLLVVLPLLGLWIVHRNRRWGFLLFAGFPLVSIIYGVTALPFISYLYGKDVMLNSLFIALVNALVCALAFWFFVSARPGYEESIPERHTHARD
ncbi:MAG: hypothetical protein PVJ39_21590 [Gammaproteobacteria bacterium]|jgi:hypothetical protein